MCGLSCSGCIFYDCGLPHNSRSFPSRFFVFLLCFIYVVSFLLLGVFIFSLLFFSPRISDHHAYALSFKPLSFRLHLDYFHSLLQQKRLLEAQSEYLFHSQVDSYFYYSQYEGRLYSSYVFLLRDMDLFLQRAFLERSYWTSAIALYPHYRDGLYRLAQLEYILFDTDKSVFYLEEARKLDPRFSLAREVMFFLRAYPNNSQ